MAASTVKSFSGESKLFILYFSMNHIVLVATLRIVIHLGMLQLLDTFITDALSSPLLTAIRSQSRTTTCLLLGFARRLDWADLQPPVQTPLPRQLL